MLSKFINVGSKVDLVPIERVKYDNLGENNKRVYETKVYDILSEDRVEVLMPMEQSKLILLPVDSEYDVSVYEGKLLYQFDARIIDRYKSNAYSKLPCNSRRHSCHFGMHKYKCNLMHATSF